MGAIPSTYLKLRAALVEGEKCQADMGLLLMLQSAAVTRRMTGNMPWTQAEMYAVMDWLELPYDMLHLYFPLHGIKV